MIMINNSKQQADDIDHLGNRRAKTVGELIQNKLRIGLRRMERVIMSACRSEIRPTYADHTDQYSSSSCCPA
jgi:DNA-directed RNA polymerase beta subunit